MADDTQTTQTTEAGGAERRPSQPSVILVATDFSEPAEAAIAAGLDLAKRDDSSSLHLVHAFTYPTPIAGPYDVALPTQYLKETQVAADNQMAAIAERARNAGIAPTTHVVSQPTVEGIVAVATEIGAQVIVVGTHGHTGLKHALLGSVAERIVRHAPCDVWVARSKEAT